VNKPDQHKTNHKSETRPASRADIFAGAGFFLFTGLFLIFMELPNPRLPTEWADTLGSAFFALFFIVPATGYTVGWIKGFPRWAYPYVGVILLISLFFMNASTPGISYFGNEVFGRELWGWRSWIPLGVATLVALSVSRSFLPLIKFFTNGYDDWTLFTFCMF